MARKKKPKVTTDAVSVLEFLKENPNFLKELQALQMQTVGVVSQETKPQQEQIETQQISKKNQYKPDKPIEFYTEESLPLFEIDKKIGERLDKSNRSRREPAVMVEVKCEKCGLSEKISGVLYSPEHAHRCSRCIGKR